MLAGREDLSFNYTNVVGAAVTTAKKNGGVLHAIVINKPVASATITIYDGPDTNGTKVATITLPATLLDDAKTVPYDVVLTAGLTVETTGAGLDITIVYR